MKRRTIDDNELVETVGTLIVAWAFAKTDRNAAVRNARKAAEQNPHGSGSRRRGSSCIWGRIIAKTR